MEDYFEDEFDVANFKFDKHSYEEWRISEYQHTYGELDSEEQQQQKDRTLEKMRELARQEYAELTKQINELPENQERRFMLLLASSTGNISDIARRENISQQVVDRTIKKALAKLGLTKDDIPRLRKLAEWNELYDKVGGV